MMYDPIQYWKQAGKTYYQDFKYNDDYKKQEDALIAYLCNIEFDSVLELGCGFGRITKLIYKTFRPSRYVAVDVSRDQLNYITIPEIETIESDILPLQLDRKFDLVIAVEVLMHQPPDKIQSIIDKMKSLSKKHVINVDYYGDGQLEPHNFKHDYTRLYFMNDKSKGFGEGLIGGVKEIEIHNQHLFHCELT